MRKIGILGGTFDPVHIGHIQLAMAAAAELSLARVALMPAHIQPFKRGKRSALPEHRLDMLRLATENYPNLTVWDREIRANGISYTFDTLSAVQAEMPDTAITFILGSDSLFSLSRWYKGVDLMRLCSFAVGLRASNNRDAVAAQARTLQEEYGAKITLLEEIIAPVSSTAVRESVLYGRAIDGMVDPKVKNYILKNLLYDGEGVD